MIINYFFETAQIYLLFFQNRANLFPGSVYIYKHTYIMIILIIFLYIFIYIYICFVIKDYNKYNKECVFCISKKNIKRTKICENG